LGFDTSIKKTVPAQVPLATSCDASFEAFEGCEEINEFFAIAIA
jgi:hypothetical protein